MRTVTGLFGSYSDARDAVTALEAAGIPSSDISLVGREVDESTNAGAGAKTGAGVGAALGGAGGLLAGLGIMAIPGVGPVVAAGWLVSTLAGAIAGAAVGTATGGIIGSLTDAGVDEDDAHVYAEGVRRGGTLVTARVEDNFAAPVQAILSSSRIVNIGQRRLAYKQEGWSRFDETSPEFTEDEIIAERERLRRLR
jgi:hypothetical protein